MAVEASAAAPVVAAPGAHCVYAVPNDSRLDPVIDELLLSDQIAGINCQNPEHADRVFGLQAALEALQFASGQLPDKKSSYKHREGAEVPS
jgi:hypothetical protein